MGSMVDANPGKEIPVSVSQSGIWFAQKLDPSATAFNLGQYCEIDGDLDLQIFEQAIRQVLGEAECLRAQFYEEDGKPRQVIAAEIEWSLPVTDLSSESDPFAAALAWMDADLARPIEIVGGEIFYYSIFRLAPRRFLWYTRYHHIAIDGFGGWTIAMRIAEIYSALVAGRDAGGSPFGPLEVLEEEERKYRSSERFARDKQ